VRFQSVLSRNATRTVPVVFWRAGRNCRLFVYLDCRVGMLLKSLSPHIYEISFEVILLWIEDKDYYRQKRTRGLFDQYIFKTLYMRVLH
jgi:hypothetical protein